MRKTTPLAEAIKIHRTIRRLTQAALAERAGLSLPTIKRIETGANVKLDTVEKIAAALQVSSATLLRGRR